MHSIFHNALVRKRAGLSEKEEGFTLIELLVVVIIIGILAAIAIPVYLGVQNQAKDSATQSDLTNWKTDVIAAQSQDNGTLPADAGAAGITATTGSTSPIYDTDGSTAFCISATSGSGKNFYITDSTSAAPGTCTAGAGTGVGIAG